MQYYNLKVDSKDEEDIPIAKTGNGKVIYLHKSGSFDRQKQEIRADNIEPLPYIQENQNLRYFIGAQSGAGKSTLVAMILKNYLKLYPKQEVFLFTAIDYDPVLDDDKSIKGKIKRIDLNDLEDLDVENFKKSLVIFDDASVSDKKIQKEIDILQDNLNRRARHYETDIINVVDKFLEGAKTNKKFLHATFLGYFVHTGGNRNELKYIFDKKLGLEKKQVADLLSGNSRWSLYHKQYPNYVIEENRVKLI